MKYRFSSKAQFDLIGIWEFTLENWSVDQADSYFNLIIGKINDICKKPELGRNYYHVRKDYWGIHVKSHIIFYRIDAGGVIEIIRILLQKMDLQKRMKE